MFEVEICTQNFTGRLLRTIPYKEAKELGLGREKLRCKAAVGESSDWFYDSFWSWALAFQRLSCIKTRGESLLPFINQSLDAAAPEEEKHELSGGVLSCPGPCSREGLSCESSAALKLREWILVLKGSRTVPLYSGPQLFDSGTDFVKSNYSMDQG